MKQPALVLLSLVMLVMLFGCGAEKVELDHTQDSYLTYVYPGEDLPHHLTYREIDFNINLVILESWYGVPVEGFSRMDDDLRGFLEWAKDKPFSNTLIREEPENASAVVALDTFCIVGWLYDDSEAAEHLARYIPEDNNIMDDRFYTLDLWRNLADEAWCVMLLQKTGVEQDRAEAILAMLLEQSEDLLADPEVRLLDKAGVTVHALLMLNEFPNHQKEKAFWKYQAVTLLEHPDIRQNNLLMANLVDVLIHQNIEQEVIAPSIALLRERETANQTWLPSTDAEPGYGDIFTTTRVLITLAHYDQHYA